MVFQITLISGRARAWPPLHAHLLLHLYRRWFPAASPLERAVLIANSGGVFAEQLQEKAYAGLDSMESALHQRDHIGVQDSVLLENYESEDAFMENLQKRFRANLIYVS